MVHLISVILEALTKFLALGCIYVWGVVYSLGMAWVFFEEMAVLTILPNGSLCATQYVVHFEGSGGPSTMMAGGHGHGMGSHHGHGMARQGAALGATPDPRTLRPSLYQFATARFDIFQPIVIEKNLQTCVCHSYD